MINKQNINSLNFRYLLQSVAVACFGISIVACSGFIKLNLPEDSHLETSKSWLMLGGNPQHHHSIDKDIYPPLTTAWKTTVKSVITNHPLAIGDYIIAPTMNGTVYFLLYDNGERVGDGKITPALSGLPTIENNILHVTGSLGKQTLVLFHLEKAEKILKDKYPLIDTAPLVYDNRIYFGATNGQFYCINRNSGEKIWTYKARASIRSSPALQDGNIVFADIKGNVYSLDAQSGIEYWSVKLEGNIYSYPVLDAQRVYIGTDKGKLFALNLKNGRTVWAQKLSGAIFGSPALFKSYLYIGDNGNSVTALNGKTGEVVWQTQTGGIINTAPLASPKFIYVGSWDKKLYMLNRYSGDVVFKVEFDKPIKTSPIIYRDMLFIQTANSKLYALTNEKFLAEWRNKK
jgi:outer membrane protein assembly factor BamB